MSFAFQGFGLGEFFKAQQKLTDILDVYFWGIFDAPSAFLSLGHMLGDFSEEIDHLFDENSNPNSAILRSDNRPNIQQILRIASHGVLDIVNELENVLQVTGDNKQDSLQDLFAVLEVSGLQPTIVDLNNKFAFQTWKLRLFFRISRKTKIQRYITILHSAQETLSLILEQHLKRGFSTDRSLPKVVSPPTDSRESFFEPYPFDIIQRFQDSCHFEGSTFCWNLKAESTLLIILHWLYTTKLGITLSNHVGEISGETYINLLKTAWLLDVTCHSTETNGLSGELKTLIAILSSEVISIFRGLHEHGPNWPDAAVLLNDGDYRIFTEGEGGRNHFGPFSTGSDIHVLPKFQRGGHDTDREESLTPSIDASQDWHTKGTGAIWSRNTHLEYPVSPVLTFDTYSTSSESVSLNISLPDEPSPPGTNIETRTTARLPTISIARFGSVSNSSNVFSPSTSLPTQVANVGSRVASASVPRNWPPERRHSMFEGLHTGASKPEIKSAIPTSPKPEYSWNQKVDTQELGLRLGEIEIMSGELSSRNLLLSYTGDLHGRWDSCNIHIFKDVAGSSLRILAVKEGIKESFDQQSVSIEETEIVPEYGYHKHEPVIYLRGSKDKANYLFFKFHNADDMFNLQSAFLNESVEADFHAVRALRIKRNNVESYQKAGVQFWHEQSTNKVNPKVVTTVALNTVSTVRSNATVKVHSTRIVMYMYREKNVVLLFVTDSIEIETRANTRTIRIRSSSHNPFKTPPHIKAKILGTQDVSGGIPLSKLGLAVEDQDNFDNFKWFEIEFGTLEELDSFQQEFQRALNLRRKERKHVDDLMRLAAQGVRR